MATSELDVILRALWKGQGIREAKRDLQDFGREGTRVNKSIGAAFTDLAKAAGVVGAAVFAAKKAFDFAKEGAELQLLESRFGNLSASIGTTADALINDLGAATGGMMSNAEMIYSASQIISLGLGSNKEEVVDLASLVSNLGWDMQQVIMTFANNSKARLDALGLSVTDVEDRMKLLEAQGYDTDKAFDLAVIEAGKAKLELLGSAAGTAAGDMLKLEAAIKDAGDRLRVEFSKGFTVIIRPMVKALDTMDVWREALDKGMVSQEEFYRAMQATNTRQVQEQTRQLADRMEWLAEQTTFVYDEFTGLDDALRESEPTWTKQRAHIEQVYRMADELGLSYEEARTKLLGLGAASEEELPEIRAAWEAVFGAEATAKTNLQDYIDVILGQETHEARERALGIAYAWGKITEEEYNAALAALNAEEVHNRVVENMEKLVGPLRDRWGEAAAAAYSYRDALLALEGLGPGGVVVTPVGGGAGSLPHPTVGDPTGRQGSPGPRTGTYGGGGAGVTPQAHGGPVSWGRPYMVGERGPELFVPSRSGTIVPNAGGAGNTYQIFMGGGMALEFTGRVSGGYMADKLAVAR